jgi:hypothetical protein
MTSPMSHKISAMSRPRWRAWFAPNSTAKTCQPYIVISPLADPVRQFRLGHARGPDELLKQHLARRRQASQLAFPQFRMAEDKRFELLRGCPQHAFQHCAPVFTTGRDRP